jgi:hypothetical protein
VTRIEEARRPPLRRLLPVEQRLSSGHVVAALLQGAGNGIELPRRRRAVVGMGRLVVVLECGVVLALRLGVRLDRLLELLHIVRERDQIVVGGSLDLCELSLSAPPVQHGSKGDEHDPAEQHEPDQNTTA